MTTPDAWVLRAASPTERPLARALLPEAFGRTVRPEVLLAVRDQPARVLGASALMTASVSGRLVARVALRVVEPERRRGVGSALLGHTLDRARALDVVSAEAWTEVAAESPGAAFCEHHGFRPIRCLERYEAEGADLERYLIALTSRLRARGRVPEDARVSQLSADDVEEVARLVTEQIGGRAGAVRDRLEALVRDRRKPGGLSMVLRRAGALAGALLVELEGDDVAVVRSRAVAPDQRGGWVNAVLLEAVLRRGIQEGLGRMAFVAARENVDTHKLARRAGARVVSTLFLYSREL